MGVLDKVGRATDEKFGPLRIGMGLLPTPIFLKAAEEKPGPGPNEGNSSLVTFPMGVFLNPR